MAQTRMKNGEYKKILIRIPYDILADLEDASTQEDRSINGELVHVLREWSEKRRQAHAHASEDEPLRAPYRPRRASAGAY